VNGVMIDLDRNGMLGLLQVPEFLANFVGQIATPSSEPPFGVEWRFTLMSGLIPALPLIFIRPFLPESPQWAAKREAGPLRRPRFSELLSPALRKTTIVTTLMVACGYGAAFGSIQMIPQIVPGLADVREAVRDKSVPAQKSYERQVATEYTKLQEI